VGGDQGDAGISMGSISTYAWVVRASLSSVSKADSWEAGEEFGALSILRGYVFGAGLLDDGPDD